jgi:hypothetical protein
MPISGMTTAASRPTASAASSRLFFVVARAFRELAQSGRHPELFEIDGPEFDAFFLNQTGQ